MAKFCGKCGQRLDASTGLCPTCEAKKMPRHITEKKSQYKNKCTKITCKKIITNFLKILVVLLLLGIFIIGGIGLLVYYKKIDIPQFSYILERSGIRKQINIDTDPQSDNYIPDEESIAFDKQTNLFYANNEILVIFSNTATEEEKKKVITYLDGNIVGTIPEINMYQIKLNKQHSKENLISISNEIMQEFDVVMYATYDGAAIHYDEQYIPNDPWNRDVTKSDWEDNTIDGSNWWMEAVNVPETWDYIDRLQEIKIGICDSSFDIGHEDLKNKVLFPNEILKGRNDVTPWWMEKNRKALGDIEDQENYHGTLVAGIIGAEGNNKKGITGIVRDSTILLAPLYRSDNMNAYIAWDSSIYANLAYLVQAGAKIVNYSQGKTNFLEENKNHESYSKEILDREGNLASLAISQLITSGYDDFIVVQSAGNGTGDTGKALDAIQNGWFASITDESMTGSQDITIDHIRSHVIIVGAVKQNAYGFEYASFSNYGSQVDICAPGVNIYSTTPGDVFYQFQFSGGYDYASGTSMSAPIVAGVCALTWSANPSLTSEQVKSIVCNNSNTEITLNIDNINYSYNMVDAGLSVKAALQYANEETGSMDQEFTDIQPKTEEYKVDIPSDAVEFKGHHYYIYNNDVAVGWNEAQVYCAKKGGYLATITSAEEDAFLYSYAVNSGYTSVMFGLSDQNELDNWEWVTGEKLSYENWHVGEPNHQNGNEHYGMYYEAFTDGKWNDGNGMDGPFICEWGDNNIDDTVGSKGQEINASQESIDEKILHIRSVYQDIVTAMQDNTYSRIDFTEALRGYSDGENVRCIIKPSQSEKELYTKYYYYEGSDLIFAYYEGLDAHRFYFDHDKLIRWRYSGDASNPDSAVNYEEETEELINWQEQVYAEAMKTKEIINRLYETGFILEGSDSRIVDSSELDGLTVEQCSLAKNEIYARRGYIFKSDEIKNYFSQFSWYEPSIYPEDFEDSVFNEYEIYNRDLIINYEGGFDS